jgi:hypothetical protein
MVFPKQKILKLAGYSDDYFLKDCKDSCFSDLIYFKEENVLNGSYGKHYGLFEVKDFLKDNKTLKSIAKKALDAYERAKMSTWNFPFSIQEWINSTYGKSKIYLSNHDIIDNRLNGIMLSKPDLPTMPLWFKGFNGWTTHKCSYSQLTISEFQAVITHILSLSNFADILLEYNNNVEKDYNEFVLDSPMEPCLERPILIYLSGNDDCSFSKTVSTLEDARIIYDILLEKGKTDDFHSLIKNLGFLFSN